MFDTFFIIDHWRLLSADNESFKARKFYDIFYGLFEAYRIFFEVLDIFMKFANFSF